MLIIKINKEKALKIFRSPLATSKNASLIIYFTGG